MGSVDRIVLRNRDTNPKSAKPWDRRNDFDISRQREAPNSFQNKSSVQGHSRIWKHGSKNKHTQSGQRGRPQRVSRRGRRLAHPASLTYLPSFLETECHSSKPS